MKKARGKAAAKHQAAKAAAKAAANSVAQETVEVKEEAVVQTETVAKEAVAQTETGIKVGVVNITYLENETVIVYVDATGSVTLTVNGTVYVNTTELIDGKAVFIIP